MSDVKYKALYSTFIALSFCRQKVGGACGFISFYLQCMYANL